MINDWQDTLTGPDPNRFKLNYVGTGHEYPGLAGHVDVYKSSYPVQFEEEQVTHFGVYTMGNRRRVTPMVEHGGSWRTARDDRYEGNTLIEERNPVGDDYLISEAEAKIRNIFLCP